MGLDIKCYPDGMYGENTYLITDEATGFRAVIDPGYYGVAVRMDIQNNAYLKYVLLTHGHHDHFLEPSDDYAYQVGLTKKSDRDGYIDHIFSSASYTSGFTADELKRGDTRLLLLSTCTYEFWEARGVLVGVIKQK